MKTSAQSRMTRHLLFLVLINASGKLSRIASRGNQATKFFNNLLSNFIQVVKICNLRSAICDLQCLHSTALTVIALMLKEIHHGGLMFVFFPPVPFKICMTCFATFQYVVCAIYGLINVKAVLNKATDAILV